LKEIINPMVFRAANQADIASIRTFGERVVVQTYLSLTSAHYVADLLDRWWSEEYFQRVIASPHHLLILMEDEQGNVIGFSEAQVEDSRCIVWKLYVDADWRGKGIGSRLLYELEQRLPPHIETMMTKFLSKNSAAGLFYRKRGFMFDHLEKDPHHSGWSYTWLRAARKNLSAMQSESPHPSSSDQHRKKAAELGGIPIAIVTVSDTRTYETDVNGRFLTEQIIAFGHHVQVHHIVRDEPNQIEALLEEICTTEARLILFNGGTGISQRDTTFDVISRKLEKTLPGFGELFRMLSYSQVGAAAMLSRATAGVYRNKVIISLPGSPAAVQLGWEKLILPELQHLAWEIIR